MSCMPPLFVIAEEYQELLLHMAEEAISEEDFNKYLEDITADFTHKSANVARVFLNLESQASEIKIAEQRMRKRRESLERNALRLREYLLTQMLSINLNEIKTPEFLIKIRNNPPKVGIASEALIPAIFKEDVTTVKIDKTSIKVALKAGNAVPGAVLEQTQRLEVR